MSILVINLFLLHSIAFSFYIHLFYIYILYTGILYIYLKGNEEKKQHYFQECNQIFMICLTALLLQHITMKTEQKRKSNVHFSLHICSTSYVHIIFHTTNKQQSNKLQGRKERKNPTFIINSTPLIMTSLKSIPFRFRTNFCYTSNMRLNLNYLKHSFVFSVCLFCFGYTYIDEIYVEEIEICYICFPLSMVLVVICYLSIIHRLNNDERNFEIHFLSLYPFSIFSKNIVVFWSLSSSLFQCFASSINKHMVIKYFYDAER